MKNMNKQVESLLQEIFTDERENKLKAEQLLRVYSSHLIKEFEKYSEQQYRKYKYSSSSSVKNDPWVLGTSEGSDHCVTIVKKLLDFDDEL